MTGIEPSADAAWRCTGWGALVGPFVLLLGSVLHPMHAPPADVVAAFTEYAADHAWGATHLLQLVGAILIGVGMGGLTHALSQGRARVWALLACAGVLISVALSAALQAVDGVALKFAVDRWAQSVGSARAAAFEAAYAIRQIEVGFAAMTQLAFGASAVLYAIALVYGARAWLLGISGALAGSSMVVAGLVAVQQGFSPPQMAISMPASLLLLGWSAAIGITLLRRRLAIEPRR